VQNAPSKIWSNGQMQFYREKLWPSPWLFIATALVIPASLLVFLPISIPAGIVSAAILYGGSVGLLIFGSPVIGVTGSTFVAGRSQLPLTVVSSVTGYSGVEAQLERGQRLDARAWLVIRGWISPIVKIQLLDVNDPTPYWIVSTRHPDAVIAAIAKAKSEAV
jgi:Protein of unknown function (DUF3093)